jgi:hypothetical protein
MTFYAGNADLSACSNRIAEQQAGTHGVFPALPIQWQGSESESATAIYILKALASGNLIHHRNLYLAAYGVRHIHQERDRVTWSYVYSRNRYDLPQILI